MSASSGPADRQRIGIILANLGTPDAPTAPAVRRYLREFLSDTRVIEVPRLIWFFILRLLILPLRPRRVAEAYASIWESGSPIRTILLAQVAAVQARLQVLHPDLDITVLPGMSYGNPGFRHALDTLRAAQVEQVIVLPLFPQFSATSTGPLYDQLGDWVKQQRNLPGLHVVRDYHVHPAYVSALAESIRQHWAVHGRAEKLLFSFHGIPQPYADKGDPYPVQCRATARAVVAELGLADGEWEQSFQSRFGLQEWVKPYTDKLLETWGHEGVASVQVLCPAFSADCLETLEEIAVENHDEFIKAGGKRYEYIPALNVTPAHVELFVSLLQGPVQALRR
ncbi:MAG: ferrochelatase [Pseudomonadota bacterium]